VTTCFCHYTHCMFINIVRIFLCITAHFNIDYDEAYVKFVRRTSNIRTVAIFVPVTLQTKNTRNFLTRFHAFYYLLITRIKQKAKNIFMRLSLRYVTIYNEGVGPFAIISRSITVRHFRVRTKRL